MSPFTALISGIGSFFSQSEPGVGAAASLERIGAGLVNGAKVMFLTFTPVGWVIKGFTALKDFLAGIDLSAAGKAIIGTLVSGIKSMAMAPVEAVRLITALTGLTTLIAKERPGEGG